MAAAVTPAGVRDGNPDALAGLCARRGPAVLAYCEHVAGEERATAATAEAFRRFRAAVVAARDLTDLNPEALLIGATRHAAAAQVPRPPDSPNVLRFVARRPATGWCGDTPSLLAARADGTISTIDAARLEQHLGGCPACRAPHARFKAAERAYRDPPDGPLPLPATAAIMAALAAAAPVTVDEAAAAASANGALPVYDPPLSPADPLPPAHVPDAESSVSDGAPQAPEAPAPEPAEPEPVEPEPQPVPVEPVAAPAPDPPSIEAHTDTPAEAPDAAIAPPTIEPPDPTPPPPPEPPAAVVAAVPVPPAEPAAHVAPPLDAVSAPPPVAPEHERYETDMPTAEYRIPEFADLGTGSETEATPAKRKLAMPSLPAFSLPSLGSLRARRRARVQRADPPLPRLERAGAATAHGSRSPRRFQRPRPAALLPAILVLLAIVIAMAVAGVFGGGDAESPPSSSPPSGAGATSNPIVVPGGDASAAAVEAAKARARARARRAERRESGSSAPASDGGGATGDQGAAPGNGLLRQPPP